MKPKRFILTSLLVVCLCSCALLAVLLPVSFLLDQATVRAAATSRLSEWAGGKIELNGPIRVSYFPDVTFEAGKVEIKGLKQLHDVAEVTAEKLSAQLSWWHLIRGKIEIAELALEEPRAIYRKPAPGPEFRAHISNDQTDWLDILKRAPVAKLIIKRGKILFPRRGNTDTSEEDNIDISAAINFSRGTGATSGRGQLSWRRKELSFDFQTGEPQRVATTAKLPIGVNVAGDLINASLKGELTIADGLQISGQQDIQLTDLRRIAEWAGHHIPPGPGLDTFRANGAFSWNGAKLAFNEAAIAIDGNDAIGALSLNLEKSRPMIEGTLDFKEISLANYLAATTPSDESKRRFQKFLDFTLLDYFDADFRLSSGKVSTGKPLAGRTALTLTVASRVLVAEIAETEIFGGEATGHLEIDATTSFPTLVLRGKLSKFSTADLIGAFSKINLLKGNAELSFDLTAQGRSAEHILKSVTGKASFNVDGDGIAMVNMKRLFSEAKAESLVGWNTSMLGETGFDTLKVTLAVKDGNIHFDDFLMKTGAQTFWGGGDIVLWNNTVNWMLCFEDGTQTAHQKTSGGHNAQRIVTLKVDGPWSHPTFQFQDEEKAFDKPSAPPTSNQNGKGIPTMNASPG